MFVLLLLHLHEPRKPTLKLKTLPDKTQTELNICDAGKQSCAESDRPRATAEPRGAARKQKHTESMTTKLKDKRTRLP